ncbi:MAG: alpha/beta hydrolase [Rhodospirillaceae bacterium]|jgi:pimeloyl-ACP methyl ester carboxylesterase|uniref:alpha/beta fold hydrolase n=1 Tax=Hwanghaeella sp. 1Z406 TaxID=3402811 RepID=UPI000C3E3D29|nr:alpha/beta hydrolase [Rhodospirillales bacterium]MAX47127.1 alpha/beta hydrolase [Rhodospirillaceae bacterium]|tara:strand:+ start:3306 stop:4088 length:783 start_codon:yes stop_codon:yes gene_type:complete
MAGPDAFFVDVTGHQLECVLYPGKTPTIIVLHEGLGSVAMWRDFPEKLAQETGHAVLVYSRYGYGRSTPCTTHPVGDRYMHREALEALPALLDSLKIDKPFLLGHSDGGSIALIHAGGSGRPVSGVITLAAHVFNEDICVAAIEQAKIAFDSTDMKDRLGRYHDDPEGAFWMWNQAWLAPSFRDWTIEEYLPHIFCPVLAIQGQQDEYGTDAQVHAIGNGVAGPAKVRILPNCRHSAHKDQSQEVLALVRGFVAAATATQ